jgi:beta-glucosidase
MKIISSILPAFFALITGHLFGQPNDIATRWRTADAETARLLPMMTLEEKLLQLLAYRPNGVPRLGIPNLQAGEALHGAVSDGCTSFPQSIALGATFDPELVGEVATVIARESRAVGMGQVYAPMLAVSRDPRWGRVEESYGEDPLLVTRMAVAYIQGAQGKGNAMFGRENVITTPKHMLADGEPWSGANGEGFETSDRNLREIHMPPFEAAVRTARTGSVMPAHHALNGVPCHSNPWLLDTLLRKEWGFDGFVTSDMGDIPKLGTGGGYGGYRLVRDDYESAIASLNAGVDMELVGKHYMADILRAVKEGRVSEATVNRAAGRVLRAKIVLLGLGETKTSDPSSAKSKDNTMDVIGSYQGKDDIWAKLIAEGKFSTPEGGWQPNWKEIVNSPEHDALALKAAQRAIVLLKNEGNFLPIDVSATKKVLVVGPIARAVNLGGYSTGKPKFYVNLMDGLKAVGGKSIEVSYSQGCPDMFAQMWGSEQEKPESPDVIAKQRKDLLANALKAAESSDVIIAVVGHTRRQLGENLDRDTLDLPGDQQALVEAMHRTGKPVVVVLNGGNVHSIPWIHGHVPAIVQAFYLGQSTGTALAQVLLGEINPGGKMPITTPRNVGQSPWYYNHPTLTGPINYYGSKSGPLYPFGHGLSYTSFRYSDLKVTGSISDTSSAEVRLSVENTGKRDGDEVVQLYTRQDLTSVTRPVMELKGFERIHLKPGERREIAFTLGFDQVKFWKDGRWVSEPGSLKLMIGSSSSDIRLNHILSLTEAAERQP